MFMTLRVGKIKLGNQYIMVGRWSKEGMKFVHDLELGRLNWEI